MQNTIQRQTLKNEYNAINVCINPVQYGRATRSACAYERPAFAYVIIFTLDTIVKPTPCVHHNSGLAKSDFGYTYTYEGDRLDRT